VAQDMLHRIEEIFSADHVPVVSSGHSGLLHHKKIEKILISLITGSSEEGFRSRNKESGQKKKLNMNEKKMIGEWSQTE
jgi:hypothetical protein